MIVQDIVAKQSLYLRIRFYYHRRQVNAVKIKAPRQFGSLRRILVEGFMFFIRKKFTCSSLYNILDKQQGCLSNSQSAGHMYVFFMILRIIVLFDTELKYPLQCTAEAD